MKNKRKINLGHIVIYANSICNAHCSFCDVGIGSSGGINKPNQNVSRNFSIEMLKKVLSDSLIKGKKIHFAFLMTEPLLAEELPLMMKLCKDDGHITKLTTNGFLLSKRAKEIINYVDFIQISLDGTQEIHDNIRGKNFFSKAIEGIKEIQKLNENIIIDINFTVSNLNYMYIIPLIDYFELNNIKLNNFKIQFMDFISKPMIDHQNKKYPNIPQVESSLTDTVDIETIDIDSLKEQLNKADTYNIKNIKKIVFKPKLIKKDELNKYFNINGEKIEKISKCTIPWSSIAIGTDGNCYWHMRCFNEYILGNVQTNSLEEIYYGEKAEYFRNALEKDDYCFPACTRCCGVNKAE